MACKKCGYIEKSQTKIFGYNFCRICKAFVPSNLEDFQNYINEKVDWKILDTFRIYSNFPGSKQKNGMKKMAKIGRVQTRPPLGYSVINKKLILNEEAIRVRAIFKTFLTNEYSFNFIAKKFSLSVNGIKKILTNRTYLGEIKFDSKIHKGIHQALISPEIFYAIQRKVKKQLRPKKN